MSTGQIDPSAGIYLKGVVSDHRTFLGALTWRQLRSVTRDPMSLQSGAARPGEDPELEAERSVHDLVQREVSGKKKANVGAYADYIAGMLGGRVGVLPPIHLWTQTILDTFDLEAGTFALVPLGESLISIDGETQLTAHWRITRSSDQIYTRELKEAHNRMPLTAVIHHGVPTSQARQYFHDLNILAVKPNVGIGLAMDTTDPIMQVVGDVETLPVLAGRVDRQSRQLSKRSDKLVTLSALRQMVIDIALGMPGIQYGARPAPVDGDQLGALRELAPKVVDGYFTTFLDTIADRDRFIAGTAPVLAAVGALAEPLTRLGGGEQDRALFELLSGLAEVDWERGKTWQGIAGDYTSRGVFSVKGTKEVAYAVHNALGDPRNPSYYRVRGRRVPLPPEPPEPRDREVDGVLRDRNGVPISSGDHVVWESPTGGQISGNVMEIDLDEEAVGVAEAGAEGEPYRFFAAGAVQVI